MSDDEVYDFAALEAEHPVTPAPTKKKPNAKPGVKKPQEKSKFSIWIGNLPYDVTKEQLLRFFHADQDEISRIQLPQHPTHSKKNKGYAYVDFKSKEAHTKAMEQSEMKLEGRAVLIKDAQDYTTTGRLPRPTKEQQEQLKIRLEQDRVKQEPQPKVFVGNLPFATTRKDVQEVLGEYGPIKAVRLGTFEDTDQCKGYAHVIFASTEGAQRCVDAALTVEGGLKVLGQRIRVEYGKVKDARSDEKKNRKRPRVPESASSLPQNTKIRFTDGE